MREFTILRDSLLEKSERFTLDSLSTLPYNQLVLCALAPAKEAVCSLKLIREEKERRKSRFLNMEPKDLAECYNYLQSHNMIDSVHFIIDIENSPKWASLSNKTKAYAKLVCMYNHTDNFLVRASECLSILRKAAVENDLDMIMTIMQKLKTLGYLYPKRISELDLREKLFTMASVIQHSFTDQEKLWAKKELIQDFSCTSDCFRLPIS